jgi:hypothetical protein
VIVAFGIGPRDEIVAFVCAAGGLDGAPPLAPNSALAIGLAAAWCGAMTCAYTIWAQVGPCVCLRLARNSI